MAEAKARFRIEGEDRTAAAFNSATKNATRSAGAMRGAFDKAFKGIAGPLTVAFSVRGITQAAAQTLNFADQLNKAATQAGLTTEAMSELAYAANLSGVNTQQLSAALRFMQKGLSEASQGVGEARQAIKALGLDLDAVRKLKPDQQFELIAEQLSKLPDPADRARAAMKLFGDSGAQLLPLMEQGAEGVRKLRDEAERLGQSFSKEQLDRLTAAKDAVDRMKASFSALAVTLMAEVAPALKGFFDDVTAFASNDKLLKLEEQLRFLDRISAMGGINIAISGDDMIGTGIFSPEEVERIRQRIAVERSKLLNQDRPTYRRGRGSTREQADEAPPGFVDAMRGLEEVTITSSRIMTTAMQQFYDSLETDTRTSTEKAVAEFEAFKAKLDELFSAGLIDTSVYNERMQEFLDKNLEEVEVSSQKIFKELETQATAFEAFAEQAAANMQTALADFLFDPFQNGLKGMLKGFIDTIRRMVAEVAAQQILTALFGGLSGSSNGFLSGLGTAFGGGKAIGGQVLASQAYLVGERGPELFVPGYTGSIVPNHKMGGGVTVAPTYNIDARGATTDLVQQLPAILSAHARKTVEMARRAINDDISRGALGRA